MADTALVGSRLREHRTQQGLRQADLAARAGISASYLNLIEHNRRRAAGDVLARLAVGLGLELEVLSNGAQGALVEDLRNAAAAGGIAVEIERLEEFAGRYPGWAGLLAAQYQRKAMLERSVEALSDRMSHDPHLQATLHEVLSALSSVRATAGILAETVEMEAVQRARFQSNLHSDAERLAAGAGALVAYLDDQARPSEGIAAPQEELEAWLALKGWHLEEVEADNTAALEAEIMALPSQAARVLARDWVTRATRDAQTMPMVAFQAAVAEVGPDPAVLAQRFGVGILAVFRRLAMLPGSKFGLVVCDGSGTLIHRKGVDGFAIPRFGAACPLWPLYTALSRPMSAVSAVLEMAGRLPQKFAVQAFCEVRHVGEFGALELREAAMLIWPQVGGKPATLAVGSTCRVCAQAQCPARSEPSILAEGS